MTRRTIGDWRIWLGLGLAVVVAMAGVMAAEYPHVAAIRRLRKSGWVIRRERSLASSSAFLPAHQPQAQIFIESRWPAWMLRESDHESSQEWFVRAQRSEILDLDLDPPDLRELESLPEIRAIVLHSTRPHVWNWRGLARLRSFETVALDFRAAEAPADLAVLRELPGLRRVSIRAVDVADATLQALSEMQHLEDLTIYSPGVAQRLGPAITTLQSQKHVTLRMGDDQQ